MFLERHWLVEMSQYSVNNINTSGSGRRSLLDKQYYALRFLCQKNLTPLLYKIILKKSGDPLIVALAQCVKNLLYNQNVLLDNKLVLKIKRKRLILDFLVNANNSNASKRRKILSQQKLIIEILPSILNYYVSTNIIAKK